MTSASQPSRLPLGLQHEGSVHRPPPSTPGSSVSDDIPTPSAMAALLRQRLGLDASGEGEETLYAGTNGSAAFNGDTGSLLDYDPDVDDEEDEEVIFDDDDDVAGGGDDEASQSARSASAAGQFKTPECMIRTSATLVVHKKDAGGPSDEADPQQPTIHAIVNRPLLVHVPPSRTKVTLRERFRQQNERMMKRDLTMEAALLNMLRFKGEEGFRKAFKDRSEAKRKLAERIKLLRETGQMPTMADRVLEAEADDSFDYEGFWREQLYLWMTRYEWRRREGPEVSKADLDREIEEWMAQKGSFATTEEMEQDLDGFMSRRGYDRTDRERLDADMDEYWAKKGTTTASNGLPATDDDTDNTSTVTSIQSHRSARQQDFTEEDLDRELHAYLNSRPPPVSGSSTDGDSMDCSMDGDSDAGGKGGSLSNGYSSLLIPKKATSTERVRRGFLNRNAVAAAAAASIGDLDKEDEDLDAYFARQKQLDQKAKEAEEAKRKEVAEGDRFADDDFQDDLDEELEWHES